MTNSTECNLGDRVILNALRVNEIAWQNIFYWVQIKISVPKYHLINLSKHSLAHKAMYSFLNITEEYQGALIGAKLYQLIDTQ